LCALQFQQIGCIVRKSDGTFDVGEIPGLGGPFSNSADYYRAWATKQNDKAPSPKFPSRLITAADRISRYPHGPFTLSHPDFGYHNFIVDDNYDLLAVIDWDRAKVRPLEFSAIVPLGLAPLHSMFWEGGRFDTPERRAEEVINDREQRKYLSWVKSHQEKVGLMIDDIWEFPQPLGIGIADAMSRFEQGNMGPWEWLIDLLERD
jgi:Phosphotransferase enzyme family